MPLHINKWKNSLGRYTYYKTYTSNLEGPNLINTEWHKRPHRSLTRKTGNFSTPVTSRATFQHKISKAILKLNYTMDQLDLIDMYRTLHSVDRE